MNSKLFYKSKTLWIALLLAFVAWVAPKQALGITAFVQNNPDLAVPIIVTGLGALFAWLRKISHGKLDFGFTDATNPPSPTN